MFLKKVKEKSNQVSYRLALTYLLFFIPCYIITFTVFYIWTADFLETRDRDLIESRIAQYQEIVEREGVAGLENIYLDNKIRSGSARYLVQLFDLKGNSLFLHMSEELEQEFKNLNGQLLQATKLKSNSWFYLESSDHDSDAVEIKTTILHNGMRLNVGASTDERDELLEKFQVIFLTIFIPLLILSIFFSIYNAQKFLRPISNLSGLIKKVKGGNLSPRADLPESKDELYELTVAFNDMLSQIEFLIEAMKETLDNVAHDLRTPIARVRLAAELALKSESPDQLKLAAEESVENLDIILNMIQTIMTVAGHNSKTLSVKKENFPALEVIEEVVDLYGFVAEEKNINITFDCPKDIALYADKFMIRQALANLLDNAIKYSPANTLVSIECLQQDKEIIFYVKDQGQGISSDDIPRIWERLFRADKSRSEKGFGLGLSLVKIFVESNDGEVSVESVLNEGSVFKVRLPSV